MKLKKYNVKIVKIFKNHKKTAKNVKQNLLGIFAISVFYLMTSMKKNKYIIVINAEFAELVEKKTHSIVIYVNAAMRQIKKTIIHAFLKS